MEVFEAALEQTTGQDLYKVGNDMYSHFTCIYKYALYIERKVDMEYTLILKRPVRYSWALCNFTKLLCLSFFLGPLIVSPRCCG